MEGWFPMWFCKEANGRGAAAGASLALIEGWVPCMASLHSMARWTRSQPSSERRRGRCCDVTDAPGAVVHRLG
eukprot:scaffold283184_cov27-Tisochrysis_lutea.AAC.1